MARRRVQAAGQRAADDGEGGVGLHEAEVVGVDTDPFDPAPHVRAPRLGAAAGQLVAVRPLGRQHQHVAVVGAGGVAAHQGRVVHEHLQDRGQFGLVQAAHRVPGGVRNAR